MRNDHVVTDTETSAASRLPLTRERVLAAAVELADRGGIESVSMRKLGQELGVEAMALYRHVRNKEEILDGIVDVVVSRIAVREADVDWKAAIRANVMAARQEMLRHPWAPRVIEERSTVGPSTLAYLNTFMGILRAAGFSLELAHHAIHVMGSRILGFNQDLFDDSADARPGPEVAERLARAMADTYPHLGELAMAARHDGPLGGCDDDVEFVFGLDLILEGLERMRVDPAPAA